LIYTYICFEERRDDIKIYSEVVGLGGSNIMFRVNSDVRMISIISKEWRNTSSSTQSIIVDKLYKK